MNPPRRHDRQSCDLRLAVVICTHNPNQKIFEWVLDAIDKQSLDRTRFRTIVVDNASDAQLSIDRARLDPKRFVVLRESKPGLAHARRLGVVASDEDIVVLVDDDNILDLDYLERVVEVFETRAEVAVVGGRTTASTDSQMPFWFSTFARNYAVGVQALDSGDVSHQRFVWGAGMAIRAAPLRRIYRSQVESCLSDREGKSLASGGDSEICRLLILLGFRLWYEEDLHLTHHLSEGRMTKAYLQKLLRSHDDCRAVFDAYDLAIWFKQLSRLSRIAAIIRHGLALCVTFGKRGSTDVLVLGGLPVRFASSSSAACVMRNVRRLAKIQQRADPLFVELASL